MVLLSPRSDDVVNLHSCAVQIPDLQINLSNISPSHAQRKSRFDVSDQYYTLTCGRSGSDWKAYHRHWFLSERLPVLVSCVCSGVTRARYLFCCRGVHHVNAFTVRNRVCVPGFVLSVVALHRMWRSRSAGLCRFD